MRMHAKVTVGLLFIGLLSASTVGLVAFYMIQRDFQQASRDMAFESFQQDITGYLTRYGNWEEANKSELFNSYVHRMRPPKPPHLRDKGEIQNHVDGRMGPRFLFLILNKDGVVLDGAGVYQIGDILPASAFEQAVSIMVGDRVAAIVSPIGDPILTPQDVKYLDAVKKSLVIGICIAIAFSLVLGSFLGKGLSRSLVKLTFAIRKMYTSLGERQKLQVTGDDELAELAIAFNEMNKELSEAHDELRELGIKDVLTDLYNRRYFDEQAKHAFEQAARYGNPLTVVIGDLDHFKRINDGFSHETGDRVLEKIGMLLKKNTRKSDVVARYGGEEFVILLSNTSCEQAAISCESIRKGIEEYPWGELHQGLKVTMSMGLCDDVTAGNVERMLSRADRNLYLAKEKGRNRVISSATS